jgi:hypothetical protein
MNKSLERYFDNTKRLHLLLTLSLLIIIITIGIPSNLIYIKGTFQGIVVAILSYTLYKNYIETSKLETIQREMKKKIKEKGDTDDDKDNKDKDTMDMRNNAIASYTLCGFIGLLLLYFTYSIFF